MHEPEVGVEPSDHMTGVWERDGRNPVVGAFLLVLLLGGVYFSIQIVAQVVLLSVDAVLTGEPTASRLRDVYRPALLAIVVATQFGVLLGAAAVIIRRWHSRRLVAYLRLDRVPPRGLVLGAVGATAIMAPAQLLARYLHDLFPALRDLSSAGSFLVEADSPIELLGVLAVLALTPAICEEFFFRAYFQRTLSRRVPGPWTVLIAGSLFALFHQQLLGLPSLLIVGIFLSYLYFAFESPYPPALAHLLYNGLQILLANGVITLPGFDPETGFGLPAALVGLALVGAVVVATERMRRAS